MNSVTLEILEPGLLTTVQDKGRYGYQRFGVPASGAMDLFALRAAIQGGNVYHVGPVQYLLIQAFQEGFEG